MSLFKNTLWNISGYIIPSLIAIPALGVLARTLGATQFGIFTLSLAIVGYASIFDAGLTRSIVREISVNRYNEVEKKRILSNATLALLMLGVFGGGMLFIFSDDIVYLLKVPLDLSRDSQLSLQLLSISLPIFLLNQAWLAALEGVENFRLVNIVKSINSSLIAGLPAIFTLFNDALYYAVAGLVVSRVISLIVTYAASKDYICYSRCGYHHATMIRLLKYGGWITVSNIISPLMSYFDRFILSNIMGANHVAHYTAPSEVIQRLSIIPNALSRAVFPKLSLFKNNLEQRKQKVLAYILMAAGILPFVLLGGLFSNEILTTWMGGEYAGIPSDILRILLLGFFFNAMAQIPFASIQARGYSKITAITHLAEVLPYLAFLYLAISEWGLIGVAVSWSLRVTVDFLILIIIDFKVKGQSVINSHYN
ncbi:oligosaccharide flippase family protein [Aeromonas caviae]|uniref:oligosaccharide flippase family protein n=1 Tax=Aeromonas caviae TaxID=648 RepID=UPI001320E4C9|nr:oligosaccharide flippase family protein [Aeromonas caviae]